MEQMIRQNREAIKKYSLIDIYNRYYEDNYNNLVYNIPRSTYFNIIEEFNKIIMHEILYNTQTYKQPCNLGEMYLISKKVKSTKLTLDYQHWKKTGEKQYLYNDHTNNRFIRLHWKRKLHFPIKNIKYYKFLQTRANKRALASFIKTDPNRYKI